MTLPEEGLERWGHKLKDTSSTEEPEETSGNLFPRACGRRESPDTPGFGPSNTDWGNSGLQNSERINFCCLSHYIFHYLLQQPYEMYILSYQVWRIILNFKQPCLKFVPTVCFPSLERAPTSQWRKPQRPGVISHFQNLPAFNFSLWFAPLCSHLICGRLLTHSFESSGSEEDAHTGSQVFALAQVTSLPHFLG